MTTIRITRRGQITLPREMRQALRLKPKQRLFVMLREDHLVLLPFRKPRELRGFVSGIDNTVERDRDRV
jgi:AbrB family looped-hinge helix DNA binding protein